MGESFGIPDNVTFEEAALLEPLSVVLNGVRVGGLRLGRPALICGAGPIGLIALAAAHASGAHPIVITDVESKRLAFTSEFVPGCMTYRVDPGLGTEGNARNVPGLFGEEGDEYQAPPTVLECTRVESSICTAAFAVRRGGVVCIIGLGKADMNNLPFIRLSLGEIRIRFINRFRDTWPADIACLRGGVLDLKKLVKHRFPLEKAVDAMDLCLDVSKGGIKAQILDEVDAQLL